MMLVDKFKNVRNTFFLLLLLVKASAQPFVHPGILHSKTDLARMKHAIQLKLQPVYAGYQVFIKDPASQYTYSMKGPLEMVGRNPTVGQAAYDDDANAAHQNAVMWVITGDKRYARKAIEIINKWCAVLKHITGRDAVLMAGLGPFKMVNAAEIIRYTNAGWKAADIKKAVQHFKEVIYPVIKDYAPFANGNWDAAAMKTCMAIGVFCNDRNIYEQALRYYTHGWGNGALINYVINNAGQIQESGRDQPHSQLGIGMLAECCAIAWNQGLDLYSYADNRLLKGFEYVAKYNLGNDELPFTEWLDRTGKYHHYKISDKGRGQLRPLYEQVFAHYVVTARLKAPYVEAVVKKLRPEGPGRPGADHPGYGTLFFAAIEDKPVPSTDRLTAPAVPAGLVACGKNDEVFLSWIKTIGNSTYTIKRATSPRGPFITVANNITANTFADTTAKAYSQYYYTVVAVRNKKNSAAAFAQAAVPGLPEGWHQADIGKINAGISYYNGTQFSIEAFGNGIGTTADAFHFTYVPIQENAALAMRIQPQPSSQFSIVALMLRADTTAGSPFVSLALYPGKTGQVEQPDWHIAFESRAVKETAAKLISQGNTVTAQAATFGRITGCIWLKLQKESNQVNAYSSYDGVNWQHAGNVQMDFGKHGLLGIAVASGMLNSTNVRVDKVKLVH